MGIVPFVPPSTIPPATHEISLPKVGRTPLQISSHGYQYLIRGNTLLSAEKLRALFASSESPQAAVNSLNQAYHQAGYFLVAIKARVIGKQINIEVIQGQIMAREGTIPLRWFFSGLEGNDALHESALIRDSILADAYCHHNGKQLRVGLVPAPAMGGTVLQLHQLPVPGYFPLSGNLLFGNYGSRYSSRYLTGATVSINPGWGTNITLNGIAGLPGLERSSKGSQYVQGGVNASSITPWGIYGFNAQWTHYRIGDAAYPLNPTGNIFVWGLTGSQLLYANDRLRWSVNEGFTHTSNIVDVYQEVIPGGYRLTTQRYGYFTLGTQGSYSYSFSGHPGTVSAVLNYNQGVSASNGTLQDNVPGAATGRFHYFTASINAYQQLPWGLNLSLSAMGQGAFNTLPQNQQWVLGGFGSLSAFYPGVLVGDSGYSGRVQIQSPNWQWAGFRTDLGLFSEIGGTTFSHLSVGQTPWQSLSDVGAALTLSSPWGTRIQVLSAIPVGWNHVTAAQRSANRVDAYFVLTQNF